MKYNNNSNNNSNKIKVIIDHMMYMVLVRYITNDVPAQLFSSCGLPIPCRVYFEGAKLL